MPNLIDQFIAEGSERLAFLVKEYGYSCATEKDEWFGTLLFSRADSSIHVFYGDRELRGSLAVARRLRGRLEPSEYALWEWLEALDVSDAPKTSVEWIQTPEQMSGFLHDISAILNLHLNKILSAGPDITLRLEESRENRLALYREQEISRDYRSAAARASDAFWANQYDKVVELLEPFNDRLSRSDEKKLAYAKKKLESGAA